MFHADSLFDLGDYAHAALFSPTEPVWHALQSLKSYMDGYQYAETPLAQLSDGTPLAESIVLHRGKRYRASECSIEYGDACKGTLVITKSENRLNGASLIMAGTILIGKRIALGNGSLIEGGATIKEPAIIGDCTEIRQGAYLRGYCLVGDRCVVGHTTEVKHSIFLNDAKAGHFAYLGDSILGNNANLGAGTKCANLKFISGNIKILYKSKWYDTGLRKFGAILGDKTQTGCNSVTNPGTIIGTGGMLMPNTTAPSGYHGDKKIIR